MIKVREIPNGVNLRVTVKFRTTLVTLLSMVITVKHILVVADTVLEMATKSCVAVEKVIHQYSTRSTEMN